MATGMVTGHPRHRTHWDPSARGSDERRNSTRTSTISLPVMSSSSHHRSYSETPDISGRLRLPPISNLIDGVRSSDLSYRPSYSDLQASSDPRMNISQGRPPLTSSNSAQWLPDHISHPHYLNSLAQQHHPRQLSDPNYHPIDYRRASVSLPQIIGSDARPGSSHLSPQAMSDPLSPDARTTGKTVVREDVIPGRGLCYVYDDGTVCQKIINGDTVNPKWGTTKAGKPRKRLGQACNTCREKKIKCDPNFPKCTQCQKFGRECRFEAPSRAPHRSPRMRSIDHSSATHILEDIDRARRPSEALTDASSLSETGTVSSRAAGTVDENLSPLTNDSNFLSDTPGPSKRMRLTRIEPENPLVHRVNGASNEIHHAFSLEVDPLKVDSDLVETYLNAYFECINRAHFPLLPQAEFMRWAIEAEEKSPVSKLVLYCMLSLGCNFARDPDRLAHGRVFAQIALDGLMQSFGYFSVQLIQARLIFAIYEFQSGREERAWDLCGAAMRTACAMNLNTENGIAQNLNEHNTVYGLDSATLAECMRRTFWMTYTMDNIGVACLSITTTLNKTDCYLRLPCTTQAYGQGSIPKTPLFGGDIQLGKAGQIAEQAAVSTFGYLVQIASLCCDVRSLAFKVNHQASHNRHQRYSATREEIEAQLRTWNENYTAHMHRRSKARSAGRSPDQSKHGYTFSFGGLHIIYHYACMQLHRQVPHVHLSRGRASEHAQSAYHHAERTLNIAEQLMSRKSQDVFDYHFAAFSPLSGYAVHYAIDVLSAAGINAKLLENQSPTMGLILNSVQLLDSLADSWASVKVQQKQVSDRIMFVMNAARAGLTEGKIGFVMEDSMIPTLRKEEDLVYGIDRLQYLRSFSWSHQIQSPRDVNVVSGKGKRTSYSIWKD